MNVYDLFENTEQLTGYIDVQTLAKMLPEVNNAMDFEDAVDKLRLGQEDHLTLPEKMQLALAFISLIRADGPQKLLAIRNLMSVQAVPQTPNIQQTQQSSPPNPAQSTQPTAY